MRGHFGGENILYYIFIIIATLTADQLAKYFALKRLEGKSGYFTAGKVLKLTIVRNSGAAMGILKNRQKLLKMITITGICGLFIYLFYAVSHGDGGLLAMSLALAAGGALGNLLDRLKQGYVLDFITINVKRFPVFNIADLFIFTGAVLYICDSIITGR